MSKEMGYFNYYMILVGLTLCFLGVGSIIYGEDSINYFGGFIVVPWGIYLIIIQFKKDKSNLLEILGGENESNRTKDY